MSAKRALPRRPFGQTGILSALAYRSLVSVEAPLVWSPQTTSRYLLHANG